MLSNRSRREDSVLRGGCTIDAAPLQENSREYSRFRIHSPELFADLSNHGHSDVHVPCEQFFEHENTKRQKTCQSGRLTTIILVSPQAYQRHKGKDGAKKSTLLPELCGNVDTALRRPRQTSFPQLQRLLQPQNR